MANLHKRMSTYVSDRQRKEEVQERLDEQKRSTVQPGDKVFVKVFRRKWYNERREGPFEVVRRTGTAVQVKGSPTWYHLSHCVKAPREEVPRSQSRDVEGSQEPGENGEEYANADEPRDESQRLFIWGIVLRIWCIFLIVPEVTLQLTDRREDSERLTFNMSQKQQSLSQSTVSHQGLQRAVTPLQERPEIQLDTDQFGA